MHQFFLNIEYSSYSYFASTRLGNVRITSGLNHSRCCAIAETLWSRSRLSEISKFLKSETATLLPASLKSNLCCYPRRNVLFYKFLNKLLNSITFLSSFFLLFRGNCLVQTTHRLVHEHIMDITNPRAPHYSIENLKHVGADAFIRLGYILHTVKRIYY